MAKPLPFQIIRKSVTIGRQDQLLSRHRSLAAAQRAFDRVLGHAVLIGPGGVVLNHRLV